MPRTNHPPTPKKTQGALLSQLAMVLADFRDAQEVATFLEDFLSSSELGALSKRLDIIWSLQQGKSYQTISQELKVSSATISSAAEVLETPGLQLACRKLATEAWAERLLQKLASWIGRSTPLEP